MIQRMKLNIDDIVTDSLNKIPASVWDNPNTTDRKSTRLNSSHVKRSRMPSSA